MNDMYYVNILNDKMIPWIQEKGPLFGYKISIGVLSILRKDPSLKIEIIHSPEEAEAARKKWYGEDKKPQILHDSVAVKDEIKIVEPEPKLAADEPAEVIEKTQEPIEEKTEKELVDKTIQEAEDTMDEYDLAIEKSLEEDPYTPSDINIAAAEKLETEPFKKYTKKELEGMTKAQLKHILNVERGFASFTKRGAKGDEYAGKYCDTQKSLIKKVLDSQK